MSAKEGTDILSGGSDIRTIITFGGKKETVKPDPPKIPPQPSKTTGTYFF